MVALKNSFCLQLSITVMIYNGVWVPDNLKYPWNLAYKLYGVAAQIFVFACIILAEIGYIYKFLDDAERMIDAAVLLLSHLVQAVKVLTIVLRQERIKRVIETVDSPEFTKADPKLQAILDRTTTMTGMVGKAFIFSAGFTAIFWCIVPFLKTDLSLPLKVAYPFSVDGPYQFAVMYAYTSVSVIVVGMGDAAENFFFCGVMTLASAQTDVLRKQLKAIGRDGSHNNYEKAKLCVKYHQSIISFVKEIASIFGFPIFCQFVVSSLIVCMTIYKITITQEPIEIITMIFYLICIFLELIIYCYPGDVLLNKSLLVAQAAYPNAWDVDTRTGKLLLLTTLRAQKPLTIDAGGIFRVSLPTAAAVIQTSYSYYALLRQQLDK